MKTLKAGHKYELGNHIDHKKSQTIQFIEKEEVDGKLVTKVDGTTTEQVIDMLINRLGYLYDKLPDTYTRAARFHLGQAANALQERTKDRAERGVEGTNQK